MDPVRITLISQDAGVREAAARAFDSAPRHWSLGLSDEPPTPDEDMGRVVWGPDVDAPDGAPRFDPADPASLAGLAPVSSATSSGLSVVSSCVGGAGVSTVALHLARAFAGMRRKTLLLETDDNGWLRQRLGLPDDVRTAQSVDGSEESLALACLPVSGGFKVLLGAPPEKRDELLRRAASLFDRIVLDAPSGMNFPTGVTGGVFLLPPTRPALRRAERSLREHDAFPWAIVCNRLGSGGALTPSLMSKELGRAVDVGLPCTPALRDVEDRSEFLPIRYRWTRAVMRVAKALDEL